MKKIISVLAIIMILILPMAFSASAITDSDFIQYLKDNNFAQEYIQFAENHFKSYSYSDAQLDEMKTHFENARVLVAAKNPEVITKGGSYFDRSKFTSEGISKISDEIVAGADAVDIKAVIKRTPTGAKYFEFYDANGKKIASAYVDSTNFKVTDGTPGSAFTYIAAVVALVAVIGGAAFVLKRRLSTAK